MCLRHFISTKGSTGYFLFYCSYFGHPRLFLQQLQDFGPSASSIPFKSSRRQINFSHLLTTLFWTYSLFCTFHPIWFPPSPLCLRHFISAKGSPGYFLFHCSYFRHHRIFLQEQLQDFGPSAHSTPFKPFWRQIIFSFHN